MTSSPTIAATAENVVAAAAASSSSSSSSPLASPTAVAAASQHHDSFWPLETYLYACRKSGKRSNSDVVKLFSSAGMKNRPFDSIFELDFSRNIVGLASFQPLLEVIARCANLRSLLLPGNSIDNARVADLCDCLEGLPALTRLNLSANPISDAGGKRLLRLLHSKTSNGTTSLYIDVSSTLMNNGLAKRISTSAAAPPPPTPPSQPLLEQQQRRPQAVQQVLGTLDALPNCSSSDDEEEEEETSVEQQQQQQQQQSDENGDVRSGSEKAMMAAGVPVAAAAAAATAGTNDPAAAGRWYALEAVWAVAAQEAGSEAEAARALSSGLPCVIACTREERKLREQEN